MFGGFSVVRLKDANLFSIVHPQSSGCVVKANGKTSCNFESSHVAPARKYTEEMLLRSRSDCLVQP